MPPAVAAAEAAAMTGVGSRDEFDAGWLAAWPA
jgi:hypothetical protein